MVQEQVDYQEKVEVQKSPGGRVVRKQVAEDKGEERRRTLSKVTQLISLLAISLELLLGFRVLLRMIAANPANAFAAFIYRISQPFAGPLLSLTPTPSFEGSVFEFPTLIAMLVYALMAWGLVQFIWIAFRRVSTRDVSVYKAE